MKVEQAKLVVRVSFFTALTQPSMSSTRIGSLQLLDSFNTTDRQNLTMLPANVTGSSSPSLYADPSDL